MRILILSIVTITFLAILSSDFAFAQVAPVAMFQSPRKQIEQGASVEQVKCNDDLILMIKSSYTSLACVKPQTAQKLIERGWGMLASSATQQKIPILSSSIKVNETDFTINYDITGGKVEAVKADISAKSLVISIKTTGNGTLIVDLPRALIDPKIKDQDSQFIILQDGQEVDYRQIKTTSTDRILAIQFSTGISKIEIIVTELT